MTSLQHSSAMLSSPRRPSSTILILSSAEKCRRVARRMSFTSRSAGAFGADFFKEDWASSSFLSHYDEAQILLKSPPQICALGSDGGHHRQSSLTFSAPVEPYQSPRRVSFLCTTLV